MKPDRDEVGFRMVPEHELLYCFILAVHSGLSHAIHSYPLRHAPFVENL
jgi:hypothetical protein